MEIFQDLPLSFISIFSFVSDNAVRGIFFWVYSMWRQLLVPHSQHTKLHCEQQDGLRSGGLCPIALINLRCALWNLHKALLDVTFLSPRRFHFPLVLSSLNSAN